MSRTAKVVNLGEARARLSRLVDEAAAGREIVIAKAGVPRARLAGLQPFMRLAGSVRRPRDLSKRKGFSKR